jgi:hypothetical protein
MRISTAVSMIAFAGCQAPSATPLGLWNTADLVSSARNGGTLPVFAPNDLVTPAGQPIEWLSPPYADAATMQAGTNDGLNLLPAFSEGKTAAFVVMAIWEGYSEVWIQPFFRFVTSWLPPDPSQNLITTMPGVISVGAQSGFYSPFWQNYWVVVPQDQRSNQFDSVKSIDDSGLQPFDGNANLFPLTPAGLLFAAPDGGQPERPLSGDSVPQVTPTTGVLDGSPQTYLPFGTDRFTWNPSTNVVNTAKLYVFAKFDTNDKPTPIGLPPIIGTGGSPVFTKGKPSFGALVDVNWVFLPSSAGAFVPSSLPSLMAKVMPDIAAMSSSQLDSLPHAYILRVATNASDCSKDPSTCSWLDSEAAILSLVDCNTVQDSGILLALGIPFFNGQAVPQ